MRNKNWYNLIALTMITWVILIAGSCKKYLDPTALSSFTPAYVFSNVQNAQKAVLAAYQEMTGDNGYGIRVSMYFPYDNDEMIGIHQIGDNDRGDIAHYNATAGNAQINTPFSQMYTGIERANICIYNIPKMDIYEKGSLQQIGELQRLYGESLTLRAQFYLELIRNWGDVPAQWLPSAMQPNLFLPKTDRDTIYNQLLSDLLTAENLVPWRTDIASVTGDPADERITRGAVKALRARIALYRGGYSLRRASSPYGQVMARPADYKTYYQIAWNECNDLMARRDEHTLNASFNTVFKGSLDAHSLDPVGEVMFQVAMAGGTGSYDSKLGYYDGVLVKTTLAGNAAIGVLPTYFYLFDSTDTRRDVTCAAYEVNADLSTLKLHPPTTLEEAKFRRDWITNPTVLTSSAQYYGVNWPLIRFSDVLLMFAEADNELNNGPGAAGISAFEEVRKRGYGGNAALIGTTPTDYAGFFNAVVKERSLEFGGEGIRKYDLIRWNLIGARLADAKTNLAAMAARSGTFTGSYANNTLDFSKLPDSVFYKTTSTSATGLQFAPGTSLYAPRTVSSVSGYSKALWVSSAIANILMQTGSSNGYAFDFKPNHSELLPIPQAALDANFNLHQDYGY